jgi:hypothetical protein
MYYVLGKSTNIPEFIMIIKQLIIITIRDQNTYTFG